MIAGKVLRQIKHVWSFRMQCAFVVRILKYLQEEMERHLN